MVLSKSDPSVFPESASTTSESANQSAIKHTAFIVLRPPPRNPQPGNQTKETIDDASPHSPPPLGYYWLAPRERAGLMQDWLAPLEQADPMLWSALLEQQCSGRYSTAAAVWTMPPQQRPRPRPTNALG